MCFCCPHSAVQLSWDHMNDDDTFFCKHELDLNGKKFTVNIDANHKATNRKRNVDLKMRLTCHYADDIIFNFDHQHDRKNWKNVRTTGNFQWKNNQNIEFENGMSYMPNKFVTKTLKIKTPFRGYERISSTVNTRMSDTEFTSTREVTWGRNKITSDETFKLLGDYEFELTYRLTTPFNQIKRFISKISNFNRNGVWNTDAEGRLNADTMSVHSEVGLQNTKKVKLEAKTSFTEYLRDLLVDLEYQGRPRDFTTKGPFLLL